MGLDMYVRRTREEVTSDVDFELEADKEVEGRPFDYEAYKRDEVFYWRKHPNLHGWMAQLYVRKGGKSPAHDFVGPVRLTLDDLKLLEADILLSKLPATTGFFFGRSDGSAEEMQNDLVFIARARDVIAQGWTLYYTSSW